MIAGSLDSAVEIYVTSISGTYNGTTMQQPAAGTSTTTGIRKLHATSDDPAAFASTTEQWVASTIAFPYSSGTPTNSCTYSSGNWFVECSDQCNITSNVAMNNNNITFNGTGVVKITANITQPYKVTAQNGCKVWVTSGGGIR